MKIIKEIKLITMLENDLREVLQLRCLQPQLNEWWYKKKKKRYDPMHII